MTPGGEVGGIGVYRLHTDASGMLRKAGVKMTLISAGKYKTEGNSYEPMTREAQAFEQSNLDASYGAFTRDVARGRGVGIDPVRNGMGQGRVLGADAALAAGMVDGVMTFDDVVRKMQRSSRAWQQQSSASAAGVIGTARALKPPWRLAAAQRELDILGLSDTEFAAEKAAARKKAHVERMAIIRTAEIELLASGGKLK